MKVYTGYYVKAYSIPSFGKMFLAICWCYSDKVNSIPSFGKMFLTNKEVINLKLGKQQLKYNKNNHQNTGLKSGRAVELQQPYRIYYIKSQKITRHHQRDTRYCENPNKSSDPNI
jgi:hypothetical protein